MELFRFSNGVTSEDIFTQDRQNAPNAFYGSMWKFAKDKERSTGQKPAKLTKEQEAIEKVKAANQKKHNERFSLAPGIDPNSHMVLEAKRLGYPVPQQDTVVPDAHVQAQAEAELQAQNPGMTKEALEELPIEELQQVAAALGIVNLRMSKDKLIKAVLSKQ